MEFILRKLIRNNKDYENEFAIKASKPFWLRKNELSFSSYKLLVDS